MIKREGAVRGYMPGGKTSPLEGSPEHHGEAGVWTDTEGRGQARGAGTCKVARSFDALQPGLGMVIQVLCFQSMPQFCEEGISK